jgi:hypothetical protein
VSEPLFDQLSRLIATPMPRRRALRLMGSTLAAATFAGLRPGAARAECLCRGGLKCCPPEGPWCCLPDWPCCPGAGPPGFAECCAPDETCCGRGGCCPPSFQCCPPILDGYTYCCEPDEHCCGGDLGQLCCDPDWFCCPGGDACAPPGGHCCPERGISCLAEDFCCGPPEYCCTGECPPGRAECGTGCCQENEVCLGGTETCCPSERVCGTTCCPLGQVCEAGSCVCPSARRCGDLCCQPGEVCDTCTNTCVACTPCDPPPPCSPTASATNNYTGTRNCFNQYLTFTGVECADGHFIKSAIGCTTHTFDRSDLTVGAVSKPARQGKGKAAQWCLSAPVTARFQVSTEVTVLRWTPDPDPCCGSICEPEIERCNNENLAHEQAHVADENAIVNAANAFWTNRTVMLCAEKRKDADNFIKDDFEREADQQTIDYIANTMEDQSEKCGHALDNCTTPARDLPCTAHPRPVCGPAAIPDAGKCAAGGPGKTCCNDGSCADHCCR